MGKRKNHKNVKKVNRQNTNGNTAVEKASEKQSDSSTATETKAAETAGNIDNKNVTENGVNIAEKSAAETVVKEAEKSSSKTVVKRTKKTAEQAVSEPGVKAVAENPAADNAVVTENAVAAEAVSEKSVPVIEYNKETRTDDPASGVRQVSNDGDDDEEDDEPAYNRRNVNRIKKAILITALLMIVIPMCLSIFLFVKVNKLEKELKECRDELSEKTTETESIEEDKEKLSEDEIKDNIEYQISMYADAKNNLLQSSEDFEFVTVDDNTEDSSVLIDDSTAVQNEDTSESQDEDSADDSQTAQTEDADKQQSADGDDSDISNIAEENKDDQVPLNGKKVYLTFDDGPSGYTDEILDILDEKGVKATFFVVAKESDYYPEYQRIVDEGHSIGIHSYSHIYDVVYKNLDYFKSDVESMHNLIYNVTGYDAWLYRFPGGSSNKVSGVNIQDCMKYLDDNGYVYFDWNAQNGDAVDYYVSPEQLNNNVMSFVRGNSGDTVVLMHDLGSHHNTVEALPDLIDTLKAEGYELLPITKDTKPVRHVQYEGDK